MERDARNHRAWERRANWIGPPWLGSYRAVDDDRLGGPKRPKALGWTVNLARPAGMAILAALIAASALATLATALCMTAL